MGEIKVSEHQGNFWRWHSCMNPGPCVDLDGDVTWSLFDYSN